MKAEVAKRAKVKAIEGLGVFGKSGAFIPGFGGKKSRGRLIDRAYVLSFVM